MATYADDQADLDAKIEALTNDYNAKFGSMEAMPCVKILETLVFEGRAPDGLWEQRPLGPFGTAPPLEDESRRHFLNRSRLASL